MIHLDDFDDDPIARERQVRTDMRSTVVWCVFLGVFFGALIWLAWAGV
ncbi:hypothetical protein AB0H58_31505 [Nocardia neocaledoniensis]